MHRAGLRFRVDFPIRTPGSRPVRPDVVFPARRIAVFVHGCFWHGCPAHGTWPTTNRVYWKQKIEGNRRRDESTATALERDGWTVVRVWEHEDAEARRPVHRKPGPRPRLDERTGDTRWWLIPMTWAMPTIDTPLP